MAHATVTIRALGPADAPAYRAQRVRALRDHPEAFGRSPTEVDSVEVWAEHFRADAGSDPDFILGAFDGDTLVGVAAVARARTWPDLESLWLDVTTTNHGALGGREPLRVSAGRRCARDPPT